MVLKEDVPKLGFRGDVVSVKAGFARNFLYPQKKAVYATKLNLAAYMTEKKEEEGVDSERERVRETIVNRLTRVEVKFKRHCDTPKPNTKSSVTAQNIVDMLEKQHGIKVGIARVVLDQPIKLIGNHNVKIRVDDHVEDEFQAAQAKVQAAGETPAAASKDAPVNFSTQTIMQQFAADRFNTAQARESGDKAAAAAVVEDPSAASKRRVVNLKVVIDRR
ncbi:Aste57867_10078 [Aphanomyces stellatus]|uniref:50S ribosomal protein L9, chloroplastic n=1 Tax=Aphanomyces stellatus TaxID=120398 RepID=A0A485KPG0_9STRA|nr:hypothetical protein As57867_010039 [Aphanomyces stellatus]VFT86954.1 Aste57867_10078 [Aphanomyces stellatus]